MASGNQKIVLDMGYTADQFRAVLPRALRAYRLSTEGASAWRVAAHDHDLSVNLSIAPRPDRQIAALFVPVLTVTISVGSGTEAARRRFRQRFDRGFHKGGG